MYITDSNGNYIPTTTIKGEDGKEVSLRISADYIQWRREDTDWTNLIALDTLVGPSGKKVLLNAVGYILQYKYDGDADWITLCDLSTYFGNTAAATAAAAANAAADRANAAAALCEGVAAGAIPPHASSHGTGGSDPITPASIGAMGVGADNGAVGAKYTTTIEPDTADKAASVIRIKDNASGNTRVLIATNEDSNNAENETSQLVLRNSSVNGRVILQANNTGKNGLRVVDENGVDRIGLYYGTNENWCGFEIYDQDGNDVTLETIGAQERFLCGRNKTIATSAWASDTTYTEYPYRASFALPSITALSFVEIVFSPADATSGNFAPVCDTYAGGVYLYAKAVPDAAITIPTIIVWR